MFARLLSVALLAVCGFGSVAQAQSGVELGSVRLADAKDADVVLLGPCASTSNTPVTKLGVRVTKHEAEINRLVVTYYDGQKQELNVRSRFKPGTESRWIDLNGEARCIKKIRIVGDTNSLGWRPGKQARVTFYGVSNKKAAKSPAGGASGVMLGKTRLKDAKDWDRLTFAPCKGSSNVPVTKLGVRVTEHQAQIDKLVVRFQNGERQELNVRHRFKPGSESRWIDLSGNARCIESIRIIGDTDTLGWRPGKQALVSFYGRTD